MIVEILSHGIGCRCRLGRYGQNLHARTRIGSRDWLWRFFDNYVGVCSTNTEGAYTGTSGRTVCFPRLELVIDVERRRLKSDLGVRGVEVNGRRNLRVGQRQNRLDKAGDSGSSVGMTEVRFGRSDGAKLCAICTAGKGTRERGDFHGITELGAGAVRLDIRNRIGTDARQLLGEGDDFGLPVLAWRGVGDLRSTVVVDRRGLQDRPNMVAVFHCLREPL